MYINDNWITQLLYYADNFGSSNYTLYFPLGVIISLITFYFLQINFFKTKGRTVTYNLIRSAFYSSIITTVVVLILVFWLKIFTEFFSTEKCELIVLIVLFLLCLFTIIITIIGKRLFLENNEHLLIGFPISRQIRNNLLFEIKKIINIRKFYWLIVLIPFLILFIKPNSKYLYSIVIDNSLSMENNLIYGVNSFGSALKYSPKDAKYVLSYLPQCENQEDCMNKASKLKTNLSDISSINFPDSLGSLTFILDNSENVINTITNNIQISGLSSPLSEMLWQNFLTTKEINENYSEKRLIILTDGADNLYFLNEKKVLSIGQSILDEKSKDGKSPREFYNKIYFINQGGDESSFLLGDCNSEILDGSNSSQYYKSVQTVMSLITFDLVFVYFCLSMVILTFITLLFINPSIKN